MRFPNLASYGWHATGFPEVPLGRASLKEKRSGEAKDALRSSSPSEVGPYLREECMYYVYLIQSESRPDQRYVGFSEDLKARLKAHNVGQSVHTAKYRPWRLVTYLAFHERQRALEFEGYLKTGSGNAFANKRLW